jgi:hypothetical protein
VRVDGDRIAGQYAALFQPPQTFGHARRRQAAGLRQRLQGSPRIGGEQLDQLLVDVVKHLRFAPKSKAIPSIIKAGFGFCLI